jgi:hypothetical protein
MTHPFITACLVCDDVREEKNRKLSLLGFFGVCPNVTIIVLEGKQPTFSFVLLANPIDATLTGGVVLSAPSGRSLTESEFGVKLSSEGQNNIGFKVLIDNCTEDGTYSLKVKLGEAQPQVFTFNVTWEKELPK